MSTGDLTVARGPGPDPIGIAGLLGLRDVLVDELGAPGLREGADGRWRADHLVVARESDEFNLQLLEGMILQTLSRYDSVPDRAALSDAGVGPVRDPGAYSAYVIAEGGSRAVLFCVGQTWCLYSKGSAAKADVGGDNGFCRILVRVFQELRPRDVYLATFSRLVRNSEFAGTVMAAARQHVDTIHCREMLIHPGDGASRMIFSFLSTVSDMERMAQATRLLLGLLAKHDRGEWWHGRDGVPIGYRLEGKRVVPDLRAKHVVRALLDGLAGPDGSPEVYARLAPFRVATPWQTGTGWAYDREDGRPWGKADADLREARRGAGGKTIADLYHPKGLVGKWRKQAVMYRDGRLPKSHECPDTGAPRFGQYEAVVRRGRKGADAPFVDVVHDLGLPPGGWAPAEVHDRVAERCAEAAARHRGPLANSRLLPLLANPARWTEGGRLWQLSHGSSASTGYSLRSIDEAEAARLGPSRPGRAFDGWNRGGEQRGRIDGSVLAHELHRAVADAAVEALSSGIGVAVLPPPADWPARPDGLVGLPWADAPDTVPLLRAAADKAERKAQRSSERYQDYDGDDQAHLDRLRENAERASAAAKQAAGAVEDALRPGDVPAEPPPRRVTAPAALLTEALVALGRAAGAVPRPVASAVGKVVRDMRMSPGPVWIGWRADLHVPTADGTLVLGPLTGRVRNRRADSSIPRAECSRTRAQEARDAREDQLLEGILGEAIPLARMLDKNARHGRAHRLRLVARLHAHYGMGRRAAELLLMCPVDVTRKAVWAMARGLEAADVSPEYADHLRAVYLSEQEPSQSRWWDEVSDRTPVVALLREHGGSIPACRARRAFAAAGLQPHGPGHLTKNSNGRPFLEKVPSPGGPRGCCDDGRCDGRVLTLRRCPSCDGYATLVARIPECPPGVLCPDCLRMPVPGSPQFPDEYGLLSNDWVRERSAVVAPDLALFRGKTAARKARRAGADVPADVPRERSRQEKQLVRAWSAENGIGLKTNNAVPNWVWERWDAAMASAALAAAAPARPALPALRNPAMVRAWAAAEGMDVPERGRLPEAVWEAYEQARRSGLS
jgi:hypothetical protein